MTMTKQEAQVAADQLIASHKNWEMRLCLATNRWKVVHGLWTFREWKRHARDYAYMQGAFRVR